MNFLQLWGSRRKAPAKEVIPVDQVEVTAKEVIPADQVEVTVYGVGLAIISENQKEPAIILLTKDQQRCLLIYADLFMCHSIQHYQMSEQSARPTIYEFTANIVRCLDGTVVAARIVAVHKGAYHAILELIDRKGKIYEIDCRPSDAIALALHSKAPVFVASHLLVNSNGLTMQYNESLPPISPSERLP